MTVDQSLRQLVAALTPLYGPREARALGEVVFLRLKGWDKTQLIIRANDEISEFLEKRLAEVTHRLLNSEPVQYIFGQARFFGNDFEVTPDVLIPRPETEGLVDLIVKDNASRPDLRVLDVGTGSGCIAIMLARNLPFSKVKAIDISTAALKVASRNSRRLRTRIEFMEGDALSLGQENWKRPGRYDIIVSNPPYIAERERADMEPNVLNFEPSSALFVPDNNPLLFYRAILQVAQTCLAPQGKVYFEVNPLFADSLVALAKGMGFVDLCLTPDFCGRKRYLSCSANS